MSSICHEAQYLRDYQAQRSRSFDQSVKESIRAIIKKFKPCPF